MSKQQDDDIWAVGASNAERRSRNGAVSPANAFEHSLADAVARIVSVMEQQTRILGTLLLLQQQVLGANMHEAETTGPDDDDENDDIARDMEGNPIRIR